MCKVAIIFFFVLISTFCFGQVPPENHPSTSGSEWEALFEFDLSNAIKPEGVWSFDDGILTATEDQNIWSEKAYTDFIIDLEFKTAEGTNSGVVVHANNLDNWIPNSVEIQIADDFSEQWATAPATWQCGAIFGHKAASEKAVKKPGKWNKYTITCKDKKIWVLLNGKMVNEIDMSLWTSGETNPDGSEIPEWLNVPLAELSLKGHVGFQGKHAGAPIYFRNIKIKTL